MTSRFIMSTLISVISMEFLSLSRRRSSARNVPSSEERGETDLFVGYLPGTKADLATELQNGNVSWRRRAQIKQLAWPTPRQNVYACARLSISGLFFSRTFQSDQSLLRAFRFCAACGSVVLLHAAHVFDYFVVIEIAFMDNQAQITETISRIGSEKVRW